MATCTQGISIRLYGPLAIRDGSARDLTPKSAKGQALWALLATSPELSRSRTWLQRKLWSTRGRTQGAASLRQALTELRRSLGVRAGILIADRRTVRLDPAQVTLIPRDSKRAEFLEGLDINDPAFRTWRTAQRGTASGAQTSAGPADTLPLAEALAQPRLLVRLTHGETDFGRQVARLFADSVLRSLGEQVHVAVQTQDLPSQPPPGALVLDIDTALQGGFMHVRAGLDRGRRAEPVWSGHREVRLRGAPPIEDIALRQLSLETTEAVFSALCQGPHRLPALGSLAQARAALLSFTPTALAQAEAQLRPLPLRQVGHAPLAWRVVSGMLRTQLAPPRDKVALRCALSHLSTAALAKAPSDGLVLASAALADLSVLGRVARGVDLAHQAVRANPNSALALDAQMLSLLYAERLDEAHRLATRTRLVHHTSPWRPWLDRSCALSCLMTGRLAEARTFNRAARAHAPDLALPASLVADLCHHLDRPQDAHRLHASLGRDRATPALWATQDDQRVPA